MAEETAPAEDRTEAATPRRQERAREEGNVAMSREVPLFAGLAAACLAWSYAPPLTANGFSERLAIFLARADATRLLGPEAFHLVWTIALPAIAPIALAAVLGGGGAVLLQTRFLISGAAARPKWQRIDPRAGLKRLLGADNLMETLKAVLKIAVICIGVAGVLPRHRAALDLLPWRDPRLLPQTIGAMLVPLAAIVLGVQAVAAVLDLTWVHIRHARQLRMSRQDVLDENKEADGDPAIKARIRRIRMQRANKRMMAQVPKAMVVVTNPTHYAVALAYDRDRNAAPRVVAKGIDDVAARIRELAKTHGVPLMANPPLARALYNVSLDAEIPADLYQAVAEVVSYVMRLNARRPGRVG